MPKTSPGSKSALEASPPLDDNGGILARALINPILALASLAGGCAGSQERPEPPSGAVDPGVHGLTSPGGERAVPRGVVEAQAPGAAGIAAHEPVPSLPAPRAAGGEPVGEATGKIVMTREHCETLGRKFSELALQQGGALGALGAGSAGEAEAAAVGKTFSVGCVRDLAGQAVEAREYQCMLRASTPDWLLACRK